MPMNAQYRGPIEMPGVIAVFPLPGALLLPRGQMPLNIFEPRYLAMVDDALRDGHRLIGMIQPDVAHAGSADKPSLYKIGCVGRITQLAESGDGAALTDFLKANDLKADWEGIERAPNEALVNALSMMSPYGAAEKQALLEAPDLKTRAEVLIAITEIELAKKNTEGEPQLQ